jgi:putative spermidine/putrescine transport system substrate-binding protein
MININQSQCQYDSNLSRRDLLKLLSLSLAGSLFGGTIGCSSKNTDKVLKIYGTGTLDVIDWSSFEKMYNVKINFDDNNNDPGPVISNMVRGTVAHDYDIGGLQGGAERELVDAGKIIEWDLTKIKNWDSVWDWAKNIPYAKINGKQYGLPVVINADSIIYLPDKVGVVDSYAMLFDPRYRGRVAMEDAWINSVIFTAIYLKESGIIGHINDPGNLEVDELEGVMEFLIRHKRNGQFLTFWSGWEHGLELIKTGSVWLMTGWEPIVYAARKEGVNVEYAVPKEGYEGWSNDLILHIGAQEHDLIQLAHEFANWELGGRYGYDLAKLRGYIVPNDSSLVYAKQHKSLVEYEQQDKIIKNVKSKFMEKKGAIYWQNVRPKNYRKYEEWWSRLRNA